MRGGGGFQKLGVLCLLCSGFLFYLARSRAEGDGGAAVRWTGGKTHVVCNDSAFASPAAFTPGLPLIYFVTPTFARREQLAELTRLGQTLAHVANLVWVVAEDSASCSPLVARALGRAGRPTVHLASPMPGMYRRALYKPRGVANRNAALDWIISHHGRASPAGLDGVVYFADDDNTYDLRLFDEIRWTRKVSMFPVGLIGKQGVSSPLVRGGKVVGFTDPWFHHRRFPVDMAGFAVNVRLVGAAGPAARMPFKAGVEEDAFLRSLGVTLGDIEPRASDCTEVLVWHTQTVRTKIPRVRAARHDAADSNLPSLLRRLADDGVLVVDDSPAGRAVPVCLEPDCS